VLDASWCIDSVLSLNKKNKKLFLVELDYEQEQVHKDPCCESLE